MNGQKGHETFVSACDILHRDGVGATFVLAGGPVPGRVGPFERLRDRVEELDPTGSWIRFDGWTDRLAEQIERSSVVVVPSTGAEPLNITALEAMSARRPVIATRVGGLPEVVVDGETGLLVPPGDPIALANAIRRLVADPVLSDAMGRAGRERARASFSIDDFEDRWRAVYGEVLD